MSIHLQSTPLINTASVFKHKTAKQSVQFSGRFRDLFSRSKKNEPTPDASMVDSGVDTYVTPNRPTVEGFPIEVIRKNNVLFTRRISDFIENDLNQIEGLDASRKTDITVALRSLMWDAEKLIQVSHEGQANDVLLAAVGKIRRVMAEMDPTARLKRVDTESLKAPINNYFYPLPGVLSRGGQPTPEGLKWLKEQGFKSVVNLRGDDDEVATGYPGFSRKNEEEKVNRLGMNYLDLGMADKTIPTPQQMIEFLSYINDPVNQPVFVHCAAGVGRTGILTALAMKDAGKPLDDVVEMGVRGGLRANDKADHRMQLSFLKQYPLSSLTNTPYENLKPLDTSARKEAIQSHPLMRTLTSGKPVVLLHGKHDTSYSFGDLDRAIEGNTSFEVDCNMWERDGKQDYVNAHDLLFYDLKKKPYPAGGDVSLLNPAKLFSRVIESGLFTKVDLKSSRVVHEYAAMASGLDVEQMMGHAFVKELKAFYSFVTKPQQLLNRDKAVLDQLKDETVSVEQLTNFHQVLGKPVPFLASCRGYFKYFMTKRKALSLAEKVADKAEFINFGFNPYKCVVKAVYEKYGLMTEIRIKSVADKKEWDALGIPYLGITDSPGLATVAIRDDL